MLGEIPLSLDIHLRTVTTLSIKREANISDAYAGVRTPCAQTVTKKCQSMALAGMSASEAPCSFTEVMSIGSGYTVGDQVVVRVQWMQEGISHEEYSPAFEVVGKAAARRLHAEEREVRAQRWGSYTRRLFSKENWDNRIGQHQQGCDTKDLHFQLGAGMLVRGRVDNVGVPKGFPMIGGLDESPELTTGFRRVGAVKPGTDARDLLPAFLCQGGLCKGALPGCTKADFNQLYTPKITFKEGGVLFLLGSR